MAAFSSPQSNPLPQPPGVRRAFTLPPSSQRPSNKQNSREKEADAQTIETLYAHPDARIIHFTTGGPGASGLALRKATNGKQDDEETGTLPWRSSTERTVASGSFRIYRVPGSVAFLNAGVLLKPVLAKSQCWCVDGEGIFVLKRSPHDYYRIELPYNTSEEKSAADNFRAALDHILRYEKTPCPFQRGFNVELPDSPEVTYVPWKPKHRPISPIRRQSVDSSAGRSRDGRLRSSEQGLSRSSSRGSSQGDSAISTERRPSTAREFSSSPLRDVLRKNSIKPHIGKFEVLDQDHQRDSLLSRRRGSSPGTPNKGVHPAQRPADFGSASPLVIQRTRSPQKLASSRSSHLDRNPTAPAALTIQKLNERLSSEADVNDVKGPDAADCSVDEGAVDVGNNESHSSNHRHDAVLEESVCLTTAEGSEPNTDIHSPGATLEAEDNSVVTRAEEQDPLVSQDLHETGSSPTLSEQSLFEDEHSDHPTPATPTNILVQVEEATSITPSEIDTAPGEPTGPVIAAEISDEERPAEDNLPERAPPAIMNTLLDEEEQDEEPIADMALPSPDELGDDASLDRQEKPTNVSEEITPILTEDSSLQDMIPEEPPESPETVHATSEAGSSTALGSLPDFGVDVLKEDELIPLDDDDFVVREIPSPILIMSEVPSQLSPELPEEPDTPLWHSVDEKAQTSSDGSLNSASTGASFITAPLASSEQVAAGLSLRPPGESIHREIRRSLSTVTLKRQGSRSTLPVTANLYVPKQDSYEHIGAVIGEKMAGMLLGPPLQLAAVMLRIASRFSNGIRIRDEEGEGWKRRGEKGRRLPGTWESYSEDEGDIGSDWEDDYGISIYGLEKEQEKESSEETES